MPRPLLLELHPDSDFSDPTCLARQVFRFSFMQLASDLLNDQRSHVAPVVVPDHLPTPTAQLPSTNSRTS